jgi:hypothetical protein
MQNGNFFLKNPFSVYFCAGEMAERSNAAVLKTVEVQASGGSNPSLSASARRSTKCKGGLYSCLNTFSPGELRCMLYYVYILKCADGKHYV